MNLLSSECVCVWNEYMLVVIGKLKFFVYDAENTVHIYTFHILYDFYLLSDTVECRLEYLAMKLCIC